MLIHKVNTNRKGTVAYCGNSTALSGQSTCYEWKGVTCEKCLRYNKSSKTQEALDTYIANNPDIHATFKTHRLGLVSATRARQQREADFFAGVAYAKSTVKKPKGKNDKSK